MKRLLGLVSLCLALGFAGCDDLPTPTEPGTSETGVSEPSLAKMSRFTFRSDKEIELGTRVIGFAFDAPPTAYQMERLTHVIAFSATVDSELRLEDEGVPDIIDLARAYGVVPMLSVGGAGRSENLNTVAKTGESRRAFARTLATYMESHGYLGVDLDWEFPSNSKEWKNYGKLLEEIRKEIGNARLLTLDVGSLPPLFFPLKSVLEAVDWVNVMAYETGILKLGVYAFAWSESFPKNRLVLGVPMYGWSAPAVPHTLPFAALVEDLGASPISDAVGEYEYNGTPTVAKKTELARDHGGVMFWQLAQDLRPGDCSLLLSAAWNTVVGSPVPTQCPRVVGEVIYEEDFSRDPGFTMTYTPGPNERFAWDPVGEFYVLRMVDVHGVDKFAFSPVFDLVNDEPFTLTVDERVVAESSGLPINMIAVEGVPPTYSFAVSHTGTRREFAVMSWGSGVGISHSTGTGSARLNVWYRIVVEYHGDGTADIAITQRDSGLTLRSFERVPFVPKRFDRFAFGDHTLHGEGRVAEIHFDNIRLTSGVE